MKAGNTNIFGKILPRKSARKINICMQFKMSTSQNHLFTNIDSCFLDNRFLRTVTLCAKQFRKRTGHFESEILVFFVKLLLRKSAREVNICIHLKCQPPETATLHFWDRRSWTLWRVTCLLRAAHSPDKNRQN